MKNRSELTEKVIRISELVMAELPYSFDIDDIFSPSRNKKLVTARSIIAYCLRRQNHSFPQIGKALNRNHATILNLQKHFKKNVDKYKEPYKSALDKIDTILSNDQVNSSLSPAEIAKQIKEQEVKLDIIEARLKVLRAQIASMQQQNEK